MLYKRGGVYEDEMIGKVWYTSKEASFNKLNNSVAEPFTGCIAAALGFPWLQLGHFRFKRLPKWQINSSVTLSRAPRFDSSSVEAETNTSLFDREEVMMFHFYIKLCKIECAGLEGRSGSTSFS